jgi:hypothetical protein
MPQPARSEVNRMGPAGLTLLRVVRMLLADHGSRGALQVRLASGQGLGSGLHSWVLLLLHVNGR